MQCFRCEHRADDLCPLCHRWVCRSCAESEGESCCSYDDEPLSDDASVEEDADGYREGDIAP